MPTVFKTLNKRTLRNLHLFPKASAKVIRKIKPTGSYHFQCSVLRGFHKKYTSFYELFLMFCFQHLSESLKRTVQNNKLEDAYGNIQFFNILASISLVSVMIWKRNLSLLNSECFIRLLLSETPLLSQHH